MARTGRLRIGRVCAGRKKAPDTLDVHPLGEEKDTRKADTDEGNSNFRSKPHGGCGHFVYRQSAKCQIVQLICRCVSYKLDPFAAVC